MLADAWRRPDRPWWVGIVLTGTGTRPALGDLVTATSTWNAVGSAINLGVPLLRSAHARGPASTARCRPLRRPPGTR